MQYVNVTAAALTDDVVTLTVASLTGLRAGYTVTVQGVNTDAQPHFDGTHVLVSTDTTTVDDVTTYTVTYGKNHPSNIPEFDCDGRITPVCTWVDDTDVVEFLGVIPATETDEAYLEGCVSAGNDWAYRRRQSAGYDDWANVVPSADVRLGTVIYCAELYRQRGSTDGFPSFSDMAALAPVGMNAQILRLLGLNRPRIA